MWPLLAALVSLCLFAAYVRDGRMAGTAAILLLNWAFCTGVVHSTGDAYPWTWFFACDYLAAFIILTMFGTPTLWQGLVGLIYAGELVCHASRGLMGSLAAIYYGWYFLYYAAWAQIVIVAGWGLYALACRRGMLGRGPSRLDAFLGGYRTRHGEAAR